ncbi:MAG: phosphoribosyl transferase [Actinobacteria bacterium RBG_16_64_13]|nr:MAG: phosphoribosyl transferase [Actinobacteria bacterium RBG_16_64_13]
MDDTGHLLADRHDAGRRLAAGLTHEAGRSDTVVLGLPRGGVVVAFEVARALDAPLDVFVVRKLGAPGQDELAIGAIASGGVRVMNDDVVRALGVSESQIERAAAREQTVLEERERLYRGHAQPLDLRGRQVIIVDDGLATGASMRTAVQALRRFEPARTVVAVPVAPAETCRSLEEQVDEVVCLMTPAPLYSVGSWYQDFSQTSDEEVIDLLEQAKNFGRGTSGRDSAGRVG